MVAVAADVEARFQAGRVIRRTFGVIRRNFPVFFGLSLLLGALPELIATQGELYFNEGDQLSFRNFGVAAAGWVLTSVGAFVLQAALIHGTVADLNGRRAGVVPGLVLGLRNILPLFALAIFMGLAIGVGLILLVVPGLFMMTAWAVAVPAIVVDRKTIGDSLGRSSDLTKGVRWQVFGLLLSYFVLAYVLAFGLGALGMMALEPTGEETMAQLGVGALTSAVISMIGAAGVAALYYELRAAKEGVGAEALAAVFD